MPVPVATDIILKTKGGCLRVRRLGFLNRAATSPPSFLDIRDTRVFMQIYSAKCLLHLFAAVSPRLQPLTNYVIKINLEQ